MRDSLVVVIGMLGDIDDTVILTHDGPTASIKKDPMTSVIKVVTMRT
jgi:hypothetical protein